MSKMDKDFSLSLDNAYYDIVNKLTKNMYKVSLFVKEEAKKNCGSDEENVANSIYSYVESSDKEVKSIIGSNAEEATELHQGTSVLTPENINEAKMPNKFLEDAVLNNISKIEEIIGGGL